MHLKSITLNPKLYPTTDHYPFNLSLFQKSQKITFQSPVTFFVGENGSGKSTLIKIIAGVNRMGGWQKSVRVIFRLTDI